jgi:hypothetical protein
MADGRWQMGDGRSDAAVPPGAGAGGRGGSPVPVPMPDAHRAPERIEPLAAGAISCAYVNCVR